MGCLDLCRVEYRRVNTNTELRQPALGIQLIWTVINKGDSSLPSSNTQLLRAGSIVPPGLGASDEYRSDRRGHRRTCWNGQQRYHRRTWRRSWSGSSSSVFRCRICASRGRQKDRNSWSTTDDESNSKGSFPFLWRRLAEIGRHRRASQCQEKGTSWKVQVTMKHSKAIGRSGHF